MPTEEKIREDAMREEFEAWAERNCCYNVRRKTDGDYTVAPVRDDWRTWQAAYRAGQASVGGRE